MRPLKFPIPRLTSFYATKLFYSAMILFYFTRLVCQFFSIWFFHLDQIGCPMFFVTVFGNYPEHFDKSITLQVGISTI